MAWLKEGCGRVDNLDLNVMREADFYEAGTGYEVRCLLCPHLCLIEDGDRGKCRARINRQGALYSESYGLPSSISSDPVEKKPLYHYFPGREIFSIGTAGCNFSCIFCQNHTISQSAPSEIPGLHYTSPEMIIQAAEDSPDGAGIAYTYNEPTVWYEYMYDIAAGAAEAGMKNVVVSNGFISPRPLDKLLDVIDAFNIDLKSFSDDFYRVFTGGALAPVKRTLKAIRNRGLHLEITHLVVTGLNDREREFAVMVDWIASELGEDTVLHISRYFPAWKLKNPPTPVSVINRFQQLAKEKLEFVYSGNMPPGSIGSDTVCPGCGALVIERSGYRVDTSGLDESGRCRVCHTKIAVVS